MTRDLKSELEAAGLSRVAPAIAGLARPSIRLLAVRADGAVLRAGHTHLGGGPDLSPGAEWPEHDGEPLIFLAQLGLATLARFRGAAELPRDGFLQFFCRRPPGSLDFDPTVVAVRLETRPSRATRRRAPEGHDPFAACAVTPIDDVSLPPPGSPEIDALGLATAELDAYAAFRTRQERGPGRVALPSHRVLGWTSHGCARDGERLLLQLASDDAPGFLFGGEAGELCFWIDERAMRRGEWGAVRATRTER